MAMPYDAERVIALRGMLQKARGQRRQATIHRRGSFFLPLHPLGWTRHPALLKSCGDVGRGEGRVRGELEAVEALAVGAEQQVKPSAGGSSLAEGS